VPGIDKFSPSRASIEGDTYEFAGPDPRVVLVHGAYADGSSWSAVIQRLQGAGLAVTAVQNPLTSLAHDVAHTAPGDQAFLVELGSVSRSTTPARKPPVRSPTSTWSST
jgi:hypothetical protein